MTEIASKPVPHPEICPCCNNEMEPRADPYYLETIYGCNDCKINLSEKWTPEELNRLIEFGEIDVQDLYGVEIIDGGDTKQPTLWDYADEPGTGLLFAA